MNSIRGALSDVASSATEACQVSSQRSHPEPMSSLFANIWRPLSAPSTSTFTPSSLIGSVRFRGQVSEPSDCSS